MKGSIVLLALGTALLVLLWLVELLDDPTGGFAFFMLILAAPLVIGIALVLFASKKELATTRGLVGAVLVVAGALDPDLLGLLAAIAGLLLLMAGVRQRAHGVRPSLALLVIGVAGLLVRLDSGDGIRLFAPIIALGTIGLALSLRRIDARSDLTDSPSSCKVGGR